MSDINTGRTGTPLGDAVSEDPPQLALEWLNKLLTDMKRVEDENKRLEKFISSRPTGTKDQRERQMLKRMEAAEAEIAWLRRALKECAAPWRSPPTTIAGAALHLSDEFKRRMYLAGDALAEIDRLRKAKGEAER